MTISRLSEKRVSKYLFFKEEAARALNVSENAILNSIARLAKKKKLTHLKKDLYQIIPEEYTQNESLPPEWFLPEFMAYLSVPYYIGLLTAASFHGVAHQAVQVFQVICQRHISQLQTGKIKVVFYYSKNFSVIPVQTLKTPAGYATISTVEGTAFLLYVSW